MMNPLEVQGRNIKYTLTENTDKTSESESKEKSPESEITKSESSDSKDISPEKSRKKPSRKLPVVNKEKSLQSKISSAGNSAEGVDAIVENLPESEDKSSFEGKGKSSTSKGNFSSTVNVKKVFPDFLELKK